MAGYLEISETNLIYNLNIAICKIQNNYYNKISLNCLIPLRKD